MSPIEAKRLSTVKRDTRRSCTGHSQLREVHDGVPRPRRGEPARTNERLAGWGWHPA